MQTYLVERMKVLESERIRVEIPNLRSLNYSTAILTAGLRDYLSYLEPVVYLRLDECLKHLRATREVKEDIPTKYSAWVTVCLGRLRKNKLHIIAEIEEGGEAKKVWSELKHLYFVGEEE
jgi:hypothetical protein